jgi:hypothetical protein
VLIRTEDTVERARAAPPWYPLRHPPHTALPNTKRNQTRFSLEAVATSLTDEGCRETPGNSKASPPLIIDRRRVSPRCARPATILDPVLGGHHLAACEPNLGTAGSGYRFATPTTDTPSYPQSSWLSHQRDSLLLVISIGPFPFASSVHVQAAPGPFLASLQARTPTASLSCPPNFALFSPQGLITQQSTHPAAATDSHSFAISLR